MADRATAERWDYEAEARKLDIIYTGRITSLSDEIVLLVKKAMQEKQTGDQMTYTYEVFVLNQGQWTVKRKDEHGVVTEAEVLAADDAMPDEVIKLAIDQAEWR